MQIINVDQNSEEWFTERKGKITGSRSKNTQIEKVIPKTEILNRFVEKDIEEAGLEFQFEVGKINKKEYTEAVKGIKKKYDSISQEDLEEMLDPEEYRDLFHKAAKKEYFRILAEKAGYEDLGPDDEYEDPRDRGHRLEDTAAEFLEREHNLQTVKAGMCVRDDYPDIAVSPDRLIVKEGQVVDMDEDGFILNAAEVTFTGAAEIKNPGVVNHLEIYLTNEIPKEYWLQVIQYFVVNDDLEILYFVSHNPNVTHHPLHVIKVYRKDIEDEIALSYRRQVKIIELLEKDVLQLTF